MTYCSPANIYGPLPQTTFFGCSVISFSASVGWNEQASEITVKLVQDCGQTFSNPKIGAPYTFEIGSDPVFKFRGILQSWVESRDSGGNPIFTVKLADPRVILDGVQLIVSDYYGHVNDPSDPIAPIVGPFNVFNLAGLIDADAGVSCPTSPAGRVSELTNRPSGIPWNTIRAYLLAWIGPNQTIVSNKFSSSNFIQYIGTGSNNSTYLLDITDVPTTNQLYTISGPTISITELLSQLGQDGGFDYYIELLESNNATGGIIKVRCVFRSTNPPSLKIRDYVGATSQNPNPTRDNVISYTYGKELRNETTSSMYMGDTARYTELISGINVLAFFGSKTGPNGVENLAYNYDSVNLFGETVYRVQIPTDKMNTQLAQPFPTPALIVSELELRAALYNFDSWLSMSVAIPGGTVAARMQSNQIRSHLVNNAQQVLRAYSGQTPAVSAYLGMSVNFINNQILQDYKIIYEVVRSFASEFYGRKWMVPVQGVCRIVDNSVFPNIRYTIDPATDGAWFEGQIPGLTEIEKHFFLDDAGKVQPFITVPLVGNARFGSGIFRLDISQISEDNLLIKGGTAYIKATMESDWVIWQNTPYAVLTTDPIMSVNPIPSYDKILSDWAGPFLINPNAAAQLPNTVPSIGLAPLVFGLSGKALHVQSSVVTLKDNQRVWGPVGYRSAIGGKVSINIDSSFNPETYGGIGNMFTALGQKILSEAAGQMTETERGSIQFAGFPPISLGQVLISGGPNVTQINCDIGPNGFTTDVQFSTYTPQFGRFTKQNAERLKEIGQSRLKFNRNLASKALESRQLAQKALTNSGSLAGSRFAPSSSHEMVVGRYIQDPDNPNKFRPEINTQSIKELTVGISQEAFPSTAFITWDGLIRPVSKSGEGNLPSYVKGNASGTPNRNDLDPFKNDHDIEIISRGNSFNANGMSTSNLGYANDYRFMALRGPLVIAGWGYDTEGKPIPSVADTNAANGEFAASGSGGFLNGYLSNAKTWPVAPVDMRFDRARKVWVAGGGGESCESGRYVPVITGVNITDDGFEFLTIQIAICDTAQTGKIVWDFYPCPDNGGEGEGS